MNFDPGYTIVRQHEGFGKIIHVAVVNPHSHTAPTEEIIRNALAGALSAAKKHEIEELSVPLLGTGRFTRDERWGDIGATYGTSIRGMLSALRAHLSGDTSVKHVRIVVPAKNFVEVKRAWLENKLLFEKP